MTKYAIVGSFLALLLSFELSAQRVTMQLSKRSMVLGEQIELQFNAEVPSAGLLPLANWFTLPDSIPHLEVLGKLPIDTISIKDNAILYRQVLLVTSFDSGYWTIPAYTLQLANGRQLATDTMGIQVKPVEVSQLKAFNTIKDIITINQTTTSWFWWAIGGGLLLVVVAVGAYFFFQRRQSKTQAKAEGTLTEEQLVQELHLLQTYLQKGAYTELMERLVPIVGQLVALKLAISVKAVTAAEWEQQIAPHMVHQASWQAYLQVLQMANLVKFAQYVPSEQECIAALDAAQNLLAHIPSPVSNTAHAV